MADKSMCDKVIGAIMSHSDGEELPEEILQHIVCCESCKAEYEKLLKMNGLVKLSAPECPELREAILDRIKSENIKVEPEKRRRHFPIGTLAAAAAILVVYVSVYGTKIPSLVFNKSADSAAIEAEYFDAEEEAFEEAAIEESDAYVYDTADAAFGDNKRSSPVIVQGERFLAAKLPEPTGTIAPIVNDTADDMKDGTAGSANITTFSNEIKLSDKDEGTQVDSIALESAVIEAEEAENDVSVLFEEYTALYPDTISYEDAELIGWDVYESFVAEVEKGNCEYTLEALKKFSQK